MEAQSKGFTNWIIGVCSPFHVSKLSGDGRERRDQLDDELRKLGKRRSNWWPSYCFVDEEYRYWDALSPRLNEEVRAGKGNISAYFVDEFEKIARQAAPIIDRIEKS